MQFRGIKASRWLCFALIGILLLTVSVRLYHFLGRSKPAGDSAPRNRISGVFERLTGLLFFWNGRDESALLARNREEYNLRAIYRGLKLLSESSPAWFSSVPKGTALETSDQVLLPLELLNFYTNASGATYKPGFGLTDGWGQLMHFIIESNVTSNTSGTTFRVFVWSNGRNQTDDRMRKDDIVVTSEDFSIRPR